MLASAVLTTLKSLAVAKESKPILKPSQIKTSEGFVFDSLGDALAYYRGNYPSGTEHRVTISDKPYRLIVYPDRFDLASTQFKLYEQG